MENDFYCDRDYVEDIKGNIYQVLGSFHLKDSVFALEKYRNLKNFDDDAFNENNYFKGDPINQIRNYESIFWKKKNSEERYYRILPNYSSIAANINIKNNEYTQFSNIFQLNLIQIPSSEIVMHWKPRIRLNNLLTIVESQKFTENCKIDNIERETIEAALNIANFYNISISNIGISGSILWESHHDKSDLDFMIYGKNNVKKIINSKKKMKNSGNGLRNLLNIELLPLAEKLALKSGLELDECFEYLYKKKYLHKFNDRKLSITFAPIYHEIPFIPYFTQKTEFIPVKEISIIAQIKNSDWGFYYPGIFQISCIEILSNVQRVEIKNIDITRLIVYEHDFIGYFQKNAIIEIRGLLQKCININDFSTNSINETYQIIVGAKETFGNEYIRLKKEI